MPIVLLPPALFSTMTGCFSRSPSCWPTMRARRSAPPPGAYGTMILIGLLGKSCAIEASGRRSAARKLASLFVVVMLMRMRVAIRAVPVIVIVHELFRHVGKKFPRRRWRPPDPFDPALLARRRQQVF